MRTFQLAMNKSQIIDQVAAYLYASGLLKDNEELIDIKGLFRDDNNPTVDIVLRKEQEVTAKVIYG